MVSGRHWPFSGADDKVIRIEQSTGRQVSSLRGPVEHLRIVENGGP
jgi:hypothetical protein